jgi:hypothetical protein
VPGLTLYSLSLWERVRDMEEATALPGGDEIVTDQVLYNM